MNTNFLDFTYVVLMAIPCAVMYWLANRYSRSDRASWGGAIFRALSWSVVTCWTLLIVTGGMVPGIIPLPSWGAAIYSIIETESARGINLLFLPHVWLSPAVPVAVYLLSYGWKQRPNHD